MVIQGGCFTTEFFRNLDPRKLMSNDDDEDGDEKRADDGSTSSRRSARRGSRRGARSKASEAPVDEEQELENQLEWERAVAAAEEATDVVALRNVLLFYSTLFLFCSFFKFRKTN